MSERVMSAHQPNFMPYLGFFDKLKKSDVFIIRDEVNFAKRDFHHRNKIRINGNDNKNNPQWAWVGVPVENTSHYLKDVLIKRDAKIGKRHWKNELMHKITSSYKNAPHFAQYSPELLEIINGSGELLGDLNLKIIDYLSHTFGINTPMVSAASLGIPKVNASEDLVALCKAVGANVYLSGDGGKKYLNLDPFKREGIEVRFQNFEPPKYKQNFSEFLPYMSAVDALMCVGKMPEGKSRRAEYEIRESGS